MLASRSLVAALLLACGSDSPSQPGAAAFTPALPELSYHGGPIIESLRVVTVTFEGDPLRDRLEKFGDTITGGAWWRAVTDGYCDARGKCVRAGQGGGHLVIPGAPKPAYDDASIQELVRALPAPVEEKVYAIYFPAGVTVREGCRTIPSYHAAVEQTRALYMVIPRCGDEATATVAASNELVGVATNPFDRSGYYLTDPIWAVRGGEASDLCEDIGQENDRVREGDFWVQRSWSIKAARARTDPCVPATGEPYFSAAPEKQMVDLRVGESITLAVTAFSDRPMPEPWSIEANDYARIVGETPSLEVKLDRSRVAAGERLELTLTLTRSLEGGFARYAIVSRYAGIRRVWFAGVR
jgi:hypothetical protein